MDVAVRLELIYVGTSIQSSHEDVAIKLELSYVGTLQHSPHEDVANRMELSYVYASLQSLQSPHANLASD